MRTATAETRDRAASPPRVRIRAPRSSWPFLVLAAACYIPLLLTAPGYVGADTKQYLYLDPGRLLARAPYLWDKHIGLGGVTHQNIGYLWPQGPWYWVFQELAVPDWIAQRLWTGTLMFAAGAGVVVLLRTFGWRNRPAFLAAAGYMLSPYLLEYVSRISIILAPWAGLPWMLALLIRGLRCQTAFEASPDASGWRGRRREGLVLWRYPALFALTVATISGTNASSFIYAGLGPTLWLPFALGRREVSLRDAVRFVVRTLLLTITICAWWIGGLTDQAGYGLNVLDYSENVRTVSSSSTPTEVLRSLGNWYFYGQDAVGAWIQPSLAFTRSLWLIAVSFAVPLVSMAAAACVRWTHRAYFVTLLVVGTALAVGASPYAHPTPFGRLLKNFENGSAAGLALRSTPRAVPLLSLALCVLVAGALESLFVRRSRRAAAGSPAPRRTRWVPVAAYAAVLVLIVLDMAPLWRGQFVDVNLRRKENLPAYVTQAARSLQASPAVDGEQTRVLELPGADFSTYRYGETLDPPLPGLMDRPYVSRELIPAGTPASAALIRAIDEPEQEGVDDPDALAPLARLMGVGDIVLRSDLQYERFLTPQPIPTWAKWTSPTVTGLGAPKEFGPKIDENHPLIPFLNEISLAEPADAALPPAMADFPVTDPVGIVRAEHADAPLLVAGDSTGLVDAAPLGLLDDTGVVRFAASKAAGGFTPVPADADLLLTDSNQKRAERWSSVSDNFGYIETATGTPLAVDPNDERLPVFTDETTADQTVAVLSGVKDVEATDYGDSVGYAVADQPFHAVDGDPTTAWEVGAFADPRGERLRVDLERPVSATAIRLVQPYGVPATRTIRQAEVTFSGGDGPARAELVTLGPASLTAAGQSVSVPQPGRTFTRVEFKIVQTSNGSLQDYSAQSGVGLAELRIPGVTASEVIRLPQDLFTAAGGNGADQALSILLTRERANPQQPFKVDPELSLAREFTLPTARSFTLAGTARISATVSDAELARLLGRTATGGDLVTATSSGYLAGSLDARATSAVDGDPSTAWTNSFGGNIGSWLQVTSPTRRTLSGLDLQVVADGRHSVPTHVALVVDGTAVRYITLPPITDRSPVGAVVSAPVHFTPVTGRTFRLVITGDRQLLTTNYFTKGPQVLPDAIAELGAAGMRVAPPATTVDTGCRSDLMTVDGKPLPISITGSTAAGVAGNGLAVTTCGPPVSLSAGTHVLRTAEGLTTGLDIDQLLLSSAAGGGAAAPADPFPGQGRTADAPHVQVTAQGAVSYRLQVSGAKPGTPFWLVLGQSVTPAWRATIGSHALGTPQLVDGYANGWLVDLSSSSFAVDLSWTAQTRIWAGIVLSAASLLICAMLVLRPTSLRLARGGPTTARAGDATVDLALPRGVAAGGGWSRARRTAVAALTAGLVAGALVAPLIGVAVLLAAVAAALVPYGRALLRLGSVGALALSVGYVLQVQARYHLPANGEWAQEFHLVATVSWAAVALLLTDVLVGWARRDVGPTPPDPRP